jgi:acetylornithine deacetylase/succinyl-diaminopimelate desuccinylase-like protein
MRIVPDMLPDETFKLYSDYVMSIVPRGIELKVKLLSMGEPSIIPTDNAFIKAATAAMEEVFGKETVFIRSGGSIPIVAEFQKHLKIPSVMMGFGLPDDNLHAPNEKFHIANFYRGIESIVRFLEKLAV